MSIFWRIMALIWGLATGYAAGSGMWLVAVACLAFAITAIFLAIFAKNEV